MSQMCFFKKPKITEDIEETYELKRQVHMLRAELRNLEEIVQNLTQQLDYNVFRL